MDIFRQYVNVTQLVFFYTLANTEIMKKTQSQQIAAALDAAMSNYYGPGKRMSGAELSRLSGVPQPTVSRTLSGKSTPETETLAKMVSVLGASNVQLGDTINAIMPLPEKAKTISPMVAKCFSLPCKSCGQKSFQSFIDLESNDRVACESCGTMIDVAEYYPTSVLQTFIESIGRGDIVLRKR